MQSMTPDTTPSSANSLVQVNERVGRRRQQRVAADAVQQALLQAKAREQEQFEAIKAEFGVDTSTVRSASKAIHNLVSYRQNRHDL